MPICYTASGKRIDLSSSAEIGRGGEGVVYRYKRHAIKIYKSNIEQDTRDKIQFICAAKFYIKIDNVIFPEFPIYSTIGASGQDIVGFGMDLAQGGRATLFRVINPRECRKSFPSFTLKDKVAVALHLVRILEKLHASNIIIGDINPRGFLVRKSGTGNTSLSDTVAAIDADSFQYQDGNRIYFCKVGQGEYTPPELQGKNLGAGVVRRESSDYFGLAVLIFQLLHDGLHPFSGYLNGQNISIEEAIRRRLYAHAPNNGMQPTTNRVVPADYPAEIQRAFMRAFSARSHERPTVTEWKKLLKDLLQELKHCPKGHHFPRSTRSCPWCASAKKATSGSFATTTGKGGTNQTRPQTQAYHASSVTQGNIKSSDVPWKLFVAIMTTVIFVYIYTFPREGGGVRVSQEREVEKKDPEQPVRNTANPNFCLTLSKKAAKLSTRAKATGCFANNVDENEAYRHCQEQGHASAQVWLTRIGAQINACISQKKRDQKVHRLQNYCRITVNSTWPLMTKLKKNGCITHALNREKMYNDCLRDPDSFRTLRQDLQRRGQGCRRERELRKQKLRRQKEYACKEAAISVQRLLKRINELGCRMRRNVDWNFLFQTCMKDLHKFKKLEQLLRQAAERCRQAYRPSFEYRWVRRDGHYATQWRAVSSPVCILDRNCNCPRKANNCRAYRPGEYVLFWPFGCSRAAVIARCFVRRRR